MAFPRLTVILNKEFKVDPTVVLSQCNAAFPPEGAGRFSLQRCGMGHVSTAKGGHDPD